MTKEEFLEELKKINISLTKKQEEQLEQFYNLLIIWNEKINLTTITKKEEVYLKHFFDSLTLIKGFDLTKKVKVLDVGTGAGFPGIVLKIVFPELEITLLDALNKRVNYLKEVIKELDLKGIDTKCIRVEDYAKVTREEYDLVVGRAVAHLGILVETCLPLVKVNGYFIAMKSNVQEEIKEAKKIIADVNASLEELIEFNLPKENSLRTLVKIKKTSPTPSKYPRRYEVIKKQYKKNK